MKIDLSKQNQNNNPYVLWNELATRIRLYDEIVFVEINTEQNYTYLNVQFKGSTKIYTYRHKDSVLSILNIEDKNWWNSLPF